MNGRITDDWLTFDAPAAHAGTSLSPPSLLRAHRGFDGAARFALDPEGGGLRAIADLPRRGGDALAQEQRVRRAAAAVLELASMGRIPDLAHTRARAERGDSVKHDRSTARATCAGRSEDNGGGECSDKQTTSELESLGWSCSARGDGGLAVELESDVLAGYRTAVVAVDARGVVVSTELQRFEETSSVSLAAVAALLLTVAGAYRFARPVLEIEDGRYVARLESRPGIGAGAEEIDIALSALSVASIACAREVAELQDETLASVFTSLRQ